MSAAVEIESCGSGRGTSYFPIAMPSLYHRDFVQFRAQLQADQQAGRLAPDLTFSRWMAARRYTANCTATTVVLPHYPPRRPTLRWKDFLEGHAYLLGHLDKYEGLGRHDRRVYLWHVANELLMDGYLMDIFEDAGFSAGDVRRVSYMHIAVIPYTDIDMSRLFGRGSGT